MDAAVRYPGRAMHWVRGNKTERVPHRWIVADCEARRRRVEGGEDQTLRCAVAARWRDDLVTDERYERLRTTSAAQFWEWVTDWCSPRGRTVLWFHNASYDLRPLDAFTWLPKLGWELDWCNLDRGVSVVTWRGPGGTLIIADTYTWLPTSLDKIAGMVGIVKPRLPKDDDSDAAWYARCEADVAITEAAVRDLIRFVKDQRLGNWQPSGAGMGWATWRHRFMDHKCLVHDDALALAAEREAMHTGRAEAWWHGKAIGGPFTEWDMHMSYCRIAAECDVPAKLWAHDIAPSKDIHEWAREHWGVLARVEVTTRVPVVPAALDGRITWPVGTFRTVLWDCELDLIRETGGKYKVIEQWRYVMKPALRQWAEWSMDMCGQSAKTISPIAATWVKHQSRALIGRLALRTPTWEHFGANPGGRPGMSTYIDVDQGIQGRMMHCGQVSMLETERTEAGNSLPQITGWIMAQARVRLWHATQAAGTEHVLHVDTDSVITTKAGSAALASAAASGLPGGWRAKTTWPRLHITGPRHYRAPGRVQVPGVPKTAVETAPGVWEGEVWESLAQALAEGRPAMVRIRERTYRPKREDHRRPYQGNTDGLATPMVARIHREDGQHVNHVVGGPRAGTQPPQDTP